MIRTLRRAAIVLFVAATACASPPADPEGSLERVRDGIVRVGFVPGDPWAIGQEENPSGIEVGLVKEFARSIDARIEWTEGSEQELFGSLELGQLDLVVGGIDSENPWSAKVALTHPYLTTQVVVAAPGDPVEEIAGLKVAVEAHTDAAGVLEKTDAVVIFVSDVAEADGPVAVEDYLVDDLGLVESDFTLIETDHVMAVRMGENGFMVALERFLLENSNLVHRLLDEAQP
jgi:polar amino acid transport system substrate-binding protein